MRCITVVFVALVAMSSMAFAEMCNCDFGRNGKCPDTLCNLYGYAATVSPYTSIEIICLDDEPTTMYIDLDWVECSYWFETCPSPIQNAEDVIVIVAGVYHIYWGEVECENFQWATGSMDLCDIADCSDFPPE